MEYWSNGIVGLKVNYPAAAAGPEGLWPGGSCGALKFKTYFHAVIPAPYQVRGKLQRESSPSKLFWTPALSGVTMI